MNCTVSRAESAVLGIWVSLAVQVLLTLLDLAERNTGHEAGDEDYGKTSALCLIQWTNLNTYKLRSRRRNQRDHCSKRVHQPPQEHFWRCGYRLRRSYQA